MAIKKQSIVNGRFTNFTNGILRVTTICENMTQDKFFLNYRQGDDF